MTVTVGAIVLTTDSERRYLSRAMESIARQEPSFDEVVIVWNGVPKHEIDATIEVGHVESPANLGIPGGRNLGVSHIDADVVVFLDDDAAIAGSDLVGKVALRFEAKPQLAVIGFRVEDRITGQALRRWAPRIGSDATTAGEVTRFPGGACAIRRETFDDLTGYRSTFFYGHEESELALRILDSGSSIEYAPDIVVHHPVTQGGSNPTRARLLGRNRVWLARLRLPWPVALLSIGLWLFAGPVRSGSLEAGVAYLKGWLEGLVDSPGPRDPVSWRTVARMTRIGQPPIV